LQVEAICWRKYLQPLHHCQINVLIRFAQFAVRLADRLAGGGDLLALSQTATLLTKGTTGASPVAVYSRGRLYYRKQLCLKSSGFKASIFPLDFVFNHSV